MGARISTRAPFAKGNKNALTSEKGRVAGATVEPLKSDKLPFNPPGRKNCRERKKEEKKEKEGSYEFILGIKRCSNDRQDIVDNRNFDWVDISFAIGVLRLGRSRNAVGERRTQGEEESGARSKKNPTSDFAMKRDDRKK